MRQRLAPMLYDDTDKQAAEAQRSSVVAKAERSPAAVTSAQTKGRADRRGYKPGQSRELLAMYQQKAVLTSMRKFQKPTIPAKSLQWREVT
jgi:hypothetical protein